MIDREPLAGAPEAGHDFVGDHQDAVLVAEFAHALEIPVGRNQNAIGPDHGLQNESGDGLRAFELHGLFDHGQRGFRRLPPALDAVIRIEHAHHARNAGLSSPAPRIAGERDGACGRPVIRPIAGHDLVPSGEEARDLDGVLVGLGAAVGEEERVDIAGSDLRELWRQAARAVRSP